MTDAGSPDDTAQQPTAEPQPATAAPQPEPMSDVASAPSSQADEPPGDETAQRRPKRRRLTIGLIAGGAALAVLFVGGAVWASFETAAHTPQAAVKPYLDALVKGDVAKALRVGDIDSRSPLVTQKVYSKTADRVTGYSIRPDRTGSNEASVVVKYLQGANHNTQVLTLKKTGTDLLFFTRWTLEPVELPTVKIAVDGPAQGVQVNGSDVPLGSSGDAELQALPGRYEVTLPSTASFTGGDQAATITQLESSGTTPGDAVSIGVSFTDAGQTAADNAVNAWVNGCIAQPTIQPAGCSFGLVDDYPDLHLANQKWTLASAPKFEIGPWDGHGWPVVTTTVGAATFLADFSADDGSYGTLFSEEPVPVRVEGEITGFGKDGTATFQSIDWSGKAAEASA
jgi:hypothetical protein